ncbi:MAG TPA: hypothetical protein VIK91_24635 [Nannocystis sp.]
MSIEVTIFADASPRAVAAFRGLREFDGERFLFPYRTPGVVTPPMGLLAARDVAGRCLDHAASFGEVDAPQPRLGVEAPAHPGLPEGVWDRQRGGRVTEWRDIYPKPSLEALGALRELSTATAARVWLVCDHERGDDPYDQWAWLFAPARSGRPAYEAVFASSGDAGRVLWQRDLIGPDPWRVLANEPTGSPVSRIIAHLELRGRGSLPIGELRAMRKYSL